MYQRCIPPSAPTSLSPQPRAPLWSPISYFLKTVMTVPALGLRYMNYLQIPSNFQGIIHSHRSSLGGDSSGDCLHGGIQIT